MYCVHVMGILGGVLQTGGLSQGSLPEGDNSVRDYNLRNYMTHIFILTSESTSDVTSLAAPRVMGAAGCAPRCQRTGDWSRTVYPGVMDTS